MAAEAKIYTRLKLDPSDFAKKLGLSEEQMKKFTQLIEKEVIRQERAMKRASKSGWGAGALKSAITSATTSMLGMTAAAVGVGAALRDAAATSMAFERSLSGLSALTGATGEDLEFIRRTAIALSAQSELSARDVVEAMKLIGGQRPELLEAADGLAAVTRATITLAEASESDMSSAARAVTGALGQFGKGAEYAATFVNVLAAGAKEGAAEIPYLQKAVEISGSSASAAGLSFEQLVAVIEGVAPKFTQAETAGTSLRAVFTKLESQTNDRLRPSVVGIHQALDNLAAQELSTAQLTKMFGTENINMARALMEARGNIQQLEGAVTGTHVAEEQAAVVTNNLQGAVKELSNAWDAFVLSLNRSDGALASAVRWVSSLVKDMTRLVSSVDALNARRREDNAAGELQKAYDAIAKMQTGGMTRSDAINKALKGYAEDARVAEEKLRGVRKILQDIDGRRKSRGGKTSYYERELSSASPLGRSPHLGEEANKALDARFNRAAKELGYNLTAETVRRWETVRENAEAMREPLLQLLSTTPVKTADTDGTGGAGAASASSASTKDSAAAMKREREARQRALEQLGEMLARARSDAEDKEISAMADGEAKRRAELNKSWRDALADVDALQKRATDTAKAAGLSGLTDEQAAAFDRLRDAVNSAALAAAGTLNKELADTAAKEREAAAAANTLTAALARQGLSMDSTARQWQERIANLRKMREELDKARASGTASPEELRQGTWALNEQRAGTYLDAAGTAARGASGLGELFSSLGLESIGDGLQKATGVVTSLISAVQGVMAVIQLVQGVMAGTQVATQTANTAAVLANTGVMSALAGVVTANTAAVGALTAATTAKAATSFIPYLQRGGVIDGYAQGGRIRGGRTTGDHLLARVNAGEMVLTRNDQSRLLAMMRSEGAQGGGTTTVRGEDIYLALSAYQKRTGRRLPL